MPPFKRARQPKMTTQALLDYDLGESSSDDSDFCIQEHDEDDDNDDSKSSGNDSSSSADESDPSNDVDDDELMLENRSEDGLKDYTKADGVEESQTNGYPELAAMLRTVENKKQALPYLALKRICCVCLGDRSDEVNEIIECDGCGVSVHEGCYGVSDTVSISSTNSTCPTEPWFCEACRAGVSEPSCELCPNKGGIYKETDVGRWVHLVCALYVPGVAFGEVDHLSSVTLFEMQYSKWGAKICSLCDNARYARVGVCIGCDAGMCKTYFHVTCAQSAGFLTEAHHEEAEAADPFYAHCKVHSDKELIKKRKRNFHTFRLNMQQRQKEQLTREMHEPCVEQQRIQRKLLKYQRKFVSHKKMRPEPWVPTQKMPRMLTTSASVCKRLLAKAKVMGVDVEFMERQEAQISALVDIRKKWHIAPAFSVEFIAYYIDRISRSKDLKEQLKGMMEDNQGLSKDQDTLRVEYDVRLEQNKEHKRKHESLLASIEEMHNRLKTLCPSKSLPLTASIGCAQQEAAKASTPPTRPISVPTAAALKMGVGFPLGHLGPPGSKLDATRLLSTHANNTVNTIVGGSGTGPGPAPSSSAPSTPTLSIQVFECGICKCCTNQHLLAKCDTCQLHYHLGCLNPPLTRHPKKSKLYGWQCSECDKSDDSETVAEVAKGPRKSRTRFNRDGIIVPVKQLSPEMIGKQQRQGVTLKRRPMDSIVGTMLQPSTSHENDKNNSIQVNLDISDSINSNEKQQQQMSVLAKKSKRGNTSIDGSAEKPESSGKNISPNIQKNKTANKPIEAILPTDEPLLLVLEQGNCTPHLTETKNLATNQDDPLALPIANDAMMMSSVAADTLHHSTSKQLRKQKRKEKHKNKHNISSDTDKSPSKEHKHKRKKKLFQQGSCDNNESIENKIEVPKIKIKFKTLPLPGEVTPEAQFFYVSADMVRSAAEGSRPSSVETVDDASSLAVPDDISLSPEKSSTVGVPATASSSYISPKRISGTKRKSSPRRSNVQRTSNGGAGSGRSKPATPLTATTEVLCCVCQQTGTLLNVVTCDECRKNYHFLCLEPPLKKSPKIRGYSWHCADCDPTDEERK